VAHERLSRLCFIDFDREMALVVERRNPETREPAILGVGRLSKIHGRDEGEFALIISDDWQNHGLGTKLLAMLVQVGRDEGLGRITASILPENSGMQRVARKLGFTIRNVPEQSECRAELNLGPAT
jgi:acetyltransferase